MLVNCDFFYSNPFYLKPNIICCKITAKSHERLLKVKALFRKNLFKTRCVDDMPTMSDCCPSNHRLQPAHTVHNFLWQGQIWGLVFNLDRRFSFHGNQCHQCQGHGQGNKTDVERQETLGRLRSITPNTVNYFASQSPLFFLVMYVVSSRSNEDFVFVSSPEVHLDYRNILTNL